MTIDWEYGDESCPKCSNVLAYRRCAECDWDNYPDDDDEWPYAGPCDNCNGKGYEEWCRECGWDNVFRCFLSPQYEAEWLAKQKGVQSEQRT